KEEAERRWPMLRQAVQRLLAQRKLDAAYRLAAAHGMGQGAAHDEAEFLAGWLALQLNEPELAYGHFDRLFHQGSGSESIARGAYWCGRAAAALGREDWAAQWQEVAAHHDGFFYGLMGALPQGAGETASPETSPLEVGPAARNAFEERPLVRALRRLHLLGFDDLLSPFFEALRAEGRGGEDYRLIAELALSLGRADEAVRRARRALGVRWSPSFAAPIFSASLTCFRPSSSPCGPRAGGARPIGSLPSWLSPSAGRTRRCAAREALSAPAGASPIFSILCRVFRFPTISRSPCCLQ